MEVRQAKGLHIAAASQITQQGETWIVPSQNSSKKYTVRYSSETQTCTCPDYEARQKVCKHIYAVQQILHPQPVAETPDPVKAQKPTYKQEWHEYNLAQTFEKARFQELLYELCRNLDEPPQAMGRPRVSLADMIFCAGVKVYEGVSGRRNMSDLREAKQRGYTSKAIHYNTISKYLERESMTSYLKELIAESSLPLKSVESDFAVDSSGFSTSRFVRWFDVKYGNTEDWHDWIKVHLICGVKTNIVTAVEVSGRHDNDSPFFQPLLEETARRGWNISEVSADKEYLSANNIRLVLVKGARAFIPFKSNSVSGGQHSTVWDRMLHFYNFHRDEFLTYYHKRSNVETTFSMIKAKFGERLRSKTTTAQYNEALLKVLCHNLCCVIGSMYELGIDTTLWSKSDSDHKV